MNAPTVDERLVESRYFLDFEQNMTNEAYWHFYRRSPIGFPDSAEQKYWTARGYAAGWALTLLAERAKH